MKSFSAIILWECLRGENKISLQNINAKKIIRTDKSVRIKATKYFNPNFLL